MDANARAGAYALFAGAAMGIVLMIVHPIRMAAPMIGDLTLNGIVHGAAIVAAPLITYGVFEIVRALGSGRPLMALGLAFYALSSASIIAAATMSGLVAPALYEAYHAATPEVAERLAPLGNLEHYFNQAFAHVYTGLASVALVLWAIAWPAQGLGGQTLRAWGALVGLGVLYWQLFAGLELNVHGMLAVTILHSSWLVAAGVALLTRRP